MDADEISTCTSADGTEDFGENPTRDTLTEGLITLLKPTVDSLENSIKHTRYYFCLFILEDEFSCDHFFQTKSA